MNDRASPPTKIRAARDWNRLAEEARGKRRDIADYIAGNTFDQRACDPSRPGCFASGYHELIEAWLKQEGTGYAP